MTALACGALAIAGCGSSSDNGGSSSSGGGGSSSGSTTVQAPAKYAKQGGIRYCTSSTNPPREFRQGSEIAGLDVDLAKAMADAMGLNVSWSEFKFDGLIPALQGGRCDMIVEELFIKPEREKVINQLPFSVSQEQIIVPKGNPQHIGELADLSGKKVAVPDGTTFQEILTGYNKKLQKQGKPTVNMLAVPSTANMFQQVAAGTANAGGATASSAQYYLQRAGGQVEPAGQPFHPIKDGFGMRKDDTQLYQAMKKALDHLMQTGQYDDILAKYKLSSASLKNAHGGS